MIGKDKLRQALEVLNEFNTQVHHVYEFLYANKVRNVLNCSTSSNLTVEFGNGPVVTTNEIDWSCDKQVDKIYEDYLYDKNSDIFFMSNSELKEWLRLYQEKEKIKQSEEYKQYLALKEKFSSIDER